MSVIVHRCPECNHNDLEHPENPGGKSSCSYGSCPCYVPRRVVAENPPEVIPSWTAPEGEPIPTITPPGQKVGGPNGTVTHACGACRDLYDRQGGMA